MSNFQYFLIATACCFLLYELNQLIGSGNSLAHHIKNYNNPKSNNLNLLYFLWNILAFVFLPKPAGTIALAYLIYGIITNIGVTILYSIQIITLAKQNNIPAENITEFSHNLSGANLIQFLQPIQSIKIYDAFISIAFLTLIIAYTVKS